MKNYNPCKNREAFFRSVCKFHELFFKSFFVGKSVNLS